MATASSTPTSPKIGAVVSQAKDTASALWVLLHARHCVDVNCRLLHCANAKGIFSLSRAASAGTKLSDDQAKAVAEARKLLCHYKQCRQSRQYNSNTSMIPQSPSTQEAFPLRSGGGGGGGGAATGGDALSSTPICLVCSLVARARPRQQTITTPVSSTRNSPQENIALDFSSSPYDPSLPAPSFQLPLHGHGTRSGGRRRAASMGSIDESSKTRSNIHSSSNTQAAKTSQISAGKMKNQSWGLPPSSKRPRSGSIQTSQRSRSNSSSSIGSMEGGAGGGGGLPVSLADSPPNLFGPLLTAASQEDTYGFGSMGFATPIGSNTINNPSTSNTSKHGGRNRSASLSALPLTNEDQVGASVLSSMFSSLKTSSGSKRARSVSWSIELSDRKKDIDISSPAWLLNGMSTNNSGGQQRNVQTKHDSQGTRSEITHMTDVGHITTFRKPLNALNHVSSPLGQSLGPRSPPTLAKLADAVDRSIHSPTSMLGYIQGFPSNQSTTTPNLAPVNLNPDSMSDKDNMGPSSPHRELSLMKLADAVQQKHTSSEEMKGGQLNGTVGIPPQQREPLPFSPHASVNNDVNVVSSLPCLNAQSLSVQDTPSNGRLNVDLERSFLNIEQSNLNSSISTSG